MPMTTVETIIRKAVADEAFRALLIANPAEALTGYDLTDEERSGLSNLDPQVFAVPLEERVSRAMRGGGWDAN